MRIQSRRWVMFLLLLWAGAVSAQDDMDDYGPKPVGGAKVKQEYEANLKHYEGNQDVLVLPGLVADRKEQRVEIRGESTGLRGEEIIEFLLVDKSSSHGYEALLWSHAKPSDVRRALEFIGLKAGAPANPAALRFRASGDRVMVDIEEDGGEQGFPIENLIMDKETGEALPAEGFVFAGSVLVDSPDGGGKQDYAADVYDPKSVASLFNEPGAMLDVPRMAMQNEVYGSQLVNPEYVLDGGNLVKIVMTPGDEKHRLREPELKLSVKSALDGSGLLCRLVDTGGVEVAKADGLSPVLEKLVGFKDQGEVPRVEFAPGANLTASVMSKTCTLLAMMEMMGALTVKSPAEGQPYYRAFVPNKMWLKPEGRPSQPWELHLGGKGSGHALTWYEPIWSSGSSSLEYKKHSFPVSSVSAAQERLAQGVEAAEKQGKPTPNVLLVYVSADASYGGILKFVQPLMETHKTLYFFIVDEAGPGSAPEE